MAADRDISVLNDLIKTTLDSMKGFEDAAEDAQNTQFAQMFADFARDRGAVVTALQTEVRRLGGTAEDDSSFLSAAHRTFMDLKQAITGKDDKAIVNEVERGEDHIKAKFDEAMADATLQPGTRVAVQEGYASVRQGHDRTRDLKHSMS